MVRNVPPIRLFLHNKCGQTYRTKLFVVAREPVDEVHAVAAGHCACLVKASQELRGRRAGRYSLVAERDGRCGASAQIVQARCERAERPTRAIGVCENAKLPVCIGERDQQLAGPEGPLIQRDDQTFARTSSSSVFTTGTTPSTMM